MISQDFRGVYSTFSLGLYTFWFLAFSTNVIENIHETFV
jgi:hypothetical protein